MLSRSVRTAARAVPARCLSALVAEEELAADWSASLYQASALSKSTLPNGVTCISTGEAASKVVGVVVSGGSATAGPGVAYAAKMVAYETTNGASGLKVQRDLETAGAIPSFDVSKTSSVAIVSTTAEAAEAAVAAAALAVGVGRAPALDWEFAELKSSPPVLADLAAMDVLDGAVYEAAFGAESPFGRPAATADSLAAVSVEEVDAYMAAVEASSPITVVGVGLDHGDLLAFATSAFAGLAPRGAASAVAAPTFAAGALVTKAAATPAAAAAVPAPKDTLLAAVLAEALGAELTADGLLLVAKASDALAAKATLAAAPSADKVAAAKLTVKTKMFGSTGADLLKIVAAGFDPSSTPAAIDAVTPAAVSAAVKAMPEPALAVLAV